MTIIEPRAANRAHHVVDLLTGDLDSPRFRLHCLWVGAGHWLKKADEFATIGTPEADEIALACRRAAALKVATYLDPSEEGDR